MKTNIRCTISENVLNLMYNLNYIVDYTDDGRVKNDGGGWLPLTDVLENLFLTEKEIRDGRSSLGQRRES